MSSSAADLIIGTYTETLPHVRGKAAGILDTSVSADGAGPTRVLAEVRNPSWVTASPDGRFLYAVIETVEFEGAPGGGVAAYSRSADGELELLNTASSMGVEPAHLALDPSGRFLLVANYRSGSIAVYAVAADGSIGELTDFVQHEGSSAHPIRQTGPHAHQVLFDPLNGTVIVPDLGMDSVLFYDLSADGHLSERVAERFVTTPGAGPRHLAFHPDGTHLFLLNELDNTLIVLRRDGDRFVQVDAASTLPAGHTEHSQGSEIRVSQSGRLVFTSNRGFDSIAIFGFDSETSSVELRHLEPTLGLEPRDFVQSPDGTRLVVANQNSDNIVTFEIDEHAPSLRYLSTSEALTPVCLLFV